MSRSTNVLENVKILLDGLDPDPYRELALRRTFRFIKTIAELSRLDNTPSPRTRKRHYMALGISSRHTRRELISRRPGALLHNGGSSLARPLQAGRDGNASRQSFS